MSKIFNKTGFADKIKDKRESMGIGVRGAGKLIGISASTVCRMENEKSAEIDNVLLVCDWLKVSITEFIKTKK
jgi:predicted transcriptional regulator